MKAHEAFPSKYIKTEDLEGKTLNVTIERVITETIKKDDGSTEEKRIVYFKGAQRGMVLNQTNWNAIADISGQQDDDDWPGTKIMLYPTKTQFGAKIVPCIRIMGPAQNAALPKAQLKTVAQAIENENPAADMDDEIPF